MIYGIIPSSLVDYPNELSFVIFFGGCNFKCGYCHNKSIVFKTSDEIRQDKVLLMLEKRKNFIKSVVITGGEPTIYNNKLIEFIKKVKNIGLNVKLDTNGTNPNVLKKLIDDNLIDFIAMDIKNIFSKYNLTCGVDVDVSKIKKSIEIIEDSDIPHLFRSTINKKMHTDSDIIEMNTYIKSDLLLQDYKYSKEQIIDIDYSKED